MEGSIVERGIISYDLEKDAKLAGEKNEFFTEADVRNGSDTEFGRSAYIKHTDIEFLE